LTGIDESDLALAVHRDQPEALEQLVCRYQDGLYRYALRLLGNEYDAQETVQETLIQAWRTLVSRYDEQKCRSLALRPWLFRITRNGALNRRRAARRQVVETDLGADAPAPAGPDPARGPLLETALAALSAGERELVALRFYEELAYAEMAAIVGRTEAAVRGGVFRALRRLRNRLNEMGYFHAM
jgi:RNA polymerase sigma-70 factor, ECF subfamily